MPTITTVDASWVNAVANDDAELRRFDTTMFLGDGSNNGVRGGIVYHGPTSLGVTVNGSDQVTVQAGAWVISAATGLGVYRGALSAATAAVALTARNATNPRIDLVVIQAPGIVKTIDGTPGASPSAPALPAQHIELARVTVPAVGGGAVTVDSTFRAYATGLGGVIPVETSARLPGSGNRRGQRAVSLATGVEYIWNGTAWLETGDLAQPVALTSTQTLAGGALALGTRLIVQGGTFTGVTDAAGDLAHAFPYAFPTGLVAVIPTLGDPVGVPTAEYVQILGANNSRNGFAVRVNLASGAACASTNVRINYLALGW